MPNYRIQAQETTCRYLYLEVEADNLDDARNIAEDQAAAAPGDAWSDPDPEDDIEIEVIDWQTLRGK